MNDDLLNYNDEGEMEKEIKKGSSPPGGGSRLSTIFLVVLGLHLLVILGVSGFHLLKGAMKSSKPEAGEVAAAKDATKTNLERPMVETQPAAPATQKLASTPKAPAKKTAPVAHEPVWKVTQPVKWDAPAAPVAKKEVKKTPVVAKPKEPVRRAVPAAPSSQYVVKKGDTLSKISRETGVSVKDLRVANSLQSDLIKIGQRLTIPGSSEGKKMLASTSGYTLYRVKKGDTLSKIARVHGTTPKTLVQLNGIKDPNKISIGMELKIPVDQVVQQQVVLEGGETAVKPFRSPITSSDLAMLREAEF